MRATRSQKPDLQDGREIQEGRRKSTKSVDLSYQGKVVDTEALLSRSEPNQQSTVGKPPEEQGDVLGRGEKLGQGDTRSVPTTSHLNTQGLGKDNRVASAHESYLQLEPVGIEREEEGTSKEKGKGRYRDHSTTPATSPTGGRALQLQQENKALESQATTRGLHHRRNVEDWENSAEHPTKHQEKDRIEQRKTTAELVIKNMTELFSSFYNYVSNQFSETKQVVAQRCGTIDYQLQTLIEDNRILKESFNLLTDEMTRVHEHNNNLQRDIIVVKNELKNLKLTNVEPFTEVKEFNKELIEIKKEVNSGATTQYNNFREVKNYFGEISKLL